MRTVVVTAHGGPEVLQVQERPDPPVGPGEVRIAVKAAGINFAFAGSASQAHSRGAHRGRGLHHGPGTLANGVHRTVRSNWGFCSSAHIEAK